MRAPSAQIESADGCAISRSPQDRAHRKELVERQFPVKDVAARESMLAFEVEGCDDLRREDLRSNARNRIFEHSECGVEQRVASTRPIGGPKRPRSVVDVDRRHVRASRCEAVIEQ